MSFLNYSNKMTDEFINKFIVERFELAHREQAQFLSYFELGEIQMFIKNQKEDRWSFSKSWSRKIKYIYEKESSTPSLLLKKLHRHGSLQRYFEFLGESYSKWLNLCLLHKLELPDFNTKGFEFKEVWEVYFKDFISFKGFCFILHDYGIGGLNNLYRFSCIYKDLNTDICKNLRLDLKIHKNISLSFSRANQETLELLKRNYQVKRLYRLFAGIKEDDDIEVLVKLLDFYTQDSKNLTRLELIMPKKPKSFRDLIKLVGINNYANFKSNYYKLECFTQPIVAFTGKEFNGFEISVPTTFAHLCEASFFMKNCIKSYITAIIDGASIVFFLKKESKFKICVELTYENGSWKVNEAKGQSNKAISSEEASVVERISHQMISFIKSEH